MFGPWAVHFPVSLGQGCNIVPIQGLSGLARAFVDITMSCQVRFTLSAQYFINRKPIGAPIGVGPGIKYEGKKVIIRFLSQGVSQYPTKTVDENAYFSCQMHAS